VGVVSIYVGHCRSDGSGESINEPWGDFIKRPEFLSSTIAQPNYFVSF
jgi:hypothetical protein